MNIAVASFQRLNKTNPAIKAAIVGARKVRMPIEVAGLTYGARTPTMNPDIMPYIGPSNGAVKLLSKMLEKVIVAGVPNTG